MTKLWHLLAFICVCVCTGTNGSVIPSYIHRCSRNDPKISECVKETVHYLRPYLKDGIKELNVPSMEPLYIGDLNILEGGPTGINVNASNLIISGASNFELKKIKDSENAKRFDFELILPRLEGEGNYNINGQIIGLPIKGHGRFTGIFTNFYAFVKVIFDVKPENGIDYVGIKDLRVRIRTGTGRLNLQNLFNGDKALGDIINDTINQNFELFVNEIITPLEKALEKKFQSMAGKIVENFTYDQLFPKDNYNQ